MIFAGTLYADQALLAEGWACNVRVSIDQRGHISGVETAAVKQDGDVDLTGRALLPAPANLHSHAFQRAMAGLTETRSGAHDSFWTWRDLMYRFVERLSPEDVETIAAAVQMEMLEAGYAACGEFHYLHHQAGGESFDNPAEMATRIAAAAETTGIGLTLLPVYYNRGGLDDRALSGGQLRFGCDRDRYEKLIGLVQTSVAALSTDCNVGVAPHSLRAVSADDLSWVQSLLPDQPVHIHIAEQTVEVADVETAYGARPVEWLLENVPVNERWCLVHATHLRPGEVKAMAASGAVAGLCPITESNLGDGIFNGTDFLGHGGCIGIGSDSNVRIALAEEMRTLEYSQRLRDHSRALMVKAGHSVGRTLLSAIARGGAQALGRGGGQIAEGLIADLLTLDTDAVHTTGLGGDKLIDAWVFAGDDQLVRDVFSAGRHVVSNGRHKNHDEITFKFRRVLKKLRANL